MAARISVPYRFAFEVLVMGMAALKLKPRLKPFHATVHVTRVEEWFVEAESAEEARELLTAGEGHRSHVGECLNLDIERVETS